MIKKIWKIWLTLGIKIGNFNSQVLMTIFYLIILFPVGIVIRTISDQLNLKKSTEKSGFNKWKYETENLQEARRQY